MDSAPLLAAVDERLRDRLEGSLGRRRGLSPLPGAPDETFMRAASHLLLAPGAKRARPWLCSKLAALVGLEGSAVIEVALAVELIHSASLLHDDVIDEAHERRGRPSVNRLYGNATALLTGDFLFAEAFRVIAPLPSGVLESALDAIGRMTRAALLEDQLTGRLDLTVAEWEEVAAGKTGALFALCGEAVAHAAGRADLAPALKQFGDALGLCFQMLDDLADLLGAEGKPRWQDLVNGAPALPTALALERPELAPKTRAVLRSDQKTPAVLEELTAVLVAAGIPDEVGRRAQAAGLAAERALLTLPPTAVREELAALAAGWVRAALSTRAVA